MIITMKRKELLQLLTPSTEKLYKLSFNLLPDSLQAEQLVIDGINAFLLKEKKAIFNKEFSTQNSSEVQSLKKWVFKSVIKHLCDIGLKRSFQLGPQVTLEYGDDFKKFFSLDATTRLVLTMRFNLSFSVDEISDLLEIPRYGVIEKIHNGRYILTTQLEPENIL